MGQQKKLGRNDQKVGGKRGKMRCHSSQWVRHGLPLVRVTKGLGNMRTKKVCSGLKEMALSVDRAREDLGSAVEGRNFVERWAENRNEGIRGNKDCFVFVCDWEKRALLEIAGVADRRTPGRGKAEGKDMEEETVQHSFGERNPNRASRLVTQRIVGEGKKRYVKMQIISVKWIT